MTFTRRTYRVAIASSVVMEDLYRARMNRAKNPRVRIWYLRELATQTAHTARLQRRKRRERK